MGSSACGPHSGICGLRWQTGLVASDVCLVVAGAYWSVGSRSTPWDRDEPRFSRAMVHGTTVARRPRHSSCDTRGGGLEHPIGLHQKLLSATLKSFWIHVAKMSLLQRIIVQPVRLPPVSEVLAPQLSCGHVAVGTPQRGLVRGPVTGPTPARRSNSPQCLDVISSRKRTWQSLSGSPLRHRRASQCPPPDRRRLRATAWRAPSDH